MAFGFIKKFLAKVRLKSPRFWLGIVGLLFAFVIIFGVFTYLFYIQDLATPESLMNRNNIGLILSDRHGEVFFKSEGVKEFEVVSIEKVPQNLKDATVAIEDKDFNKHPGFSIRSILRAFYTNLISRSPTRYGASTITQQLVKNALLSPEKSIKRKFQEIILAIEIDRRYSKDKILEMYLNSIYYGSGAYGVSSASEIYFDKEISDLTLAEASYLAALTQRPSQLSPFTGDLDALEERKNIVLDLMVEQGYISEDKADKASNEKVKFAKAPEELESSQAPHFAVWVRDYLYQKYGEGNVNRSGFRVKTSLDLTYQAIAQKAVAAQVARLAKQNVTNGGLISFDPYSGEILSMVGSMDWANEDFGKFNVVFARRQPGSSFKPIVYTKAFSDGMKTTDILHDKPTDYSGYKPKNYDGKFRGDVTLRKALANSLNVPAVELLNKVGVRDAVDLAKDMGMTTLTDPDRYGLSLVLGGGEVELFELTRAYGVLATGGELVPSHPILAIEDKLGKKIYEYNPFTKKEEDNFNPGVISLFEGTAEPFKDKFIGGGGSKRVVDEASAYLTTHILADDKARGEIFGTGSALLLSRQSGAKTGTTDDYRDSWTIGYTPDVVTGVWIGNNDNSPMGRVAGSIGAAPIWREYMEAVHRGKTVREFARPANILIIEICLTNFERACTGCENKYIEVFKKGSEPSNICPEEITSVPEPTEEPTETPEPETTEEPTEEPETSPTPLAIPTLPLVTPTPTQSLIPTI